MIHNKLTDMPHIPLDRVSLGWKLRSTVEAWGTNIGELAKEFTVETEGKMPFAVTIHLFGKAKAQHREACAVLFGHEVLRQRFHANSHAGVEQSTANETDPNLEEFSPWEWHIRRTLPQMYVSGSKSQAARGDWVVWHHTDKLAEYLHLPEKHPSRLVIYCRGLSRRLPPFEWFQDAIVLVWSSTTGRPYRSGMPCFFKKLSHTSFSKIN